MLDATGPVKRAVIAATTTGDNTLVAAVTGKRIRVLSVVMSVSGALSARFESGAGVTALTGVMPLAANTVLQLDHNPLGWFETAAGALLNLELSANACHGFIVYQEAK